MAGQCDTWLAALKAAGKGGIVFRQLQIDRGLPYEKVLSFGADLSGDAITASLRSGPDASGATLVNFTVTVGAYAASATEVAISLTSGQTAALPADSDLDGEEQFAFDILRNGTRLMGGMIPVAGKVTNA